MELCDFYVLITLSQNINILPENLTFMAYYNDKVVTILEDDSQFLPLFNKYQSYPESFYSQFQ